MCSSDLTTSGSAPKRARQNAFVRITTFVWPRWFSSGRKVRPREAVTPSSGKKEDSRREHACGLATSGDLEITRRGRAGRVLHTRGSPLE